METFGESPVTLAAAVIRPLRLVVLGTCVALVLLGAAALALTSGVRGLTMATTIELTIFIVITAGPTILIGRAIKPLPADGNPLLGLAALRYLTYLRLSTAGSCALQGFAISNYTDNATPYLIAGPIALILQLGVVYPRQATIRAVARRLEANGSDSGLGVLIH